MAIDYNFQIETQRKPEDFLELILTINGFQKNTDENSFFADGLVGNVGFEETHSQNLTKEDFGFVPQIYVWFTPFRGEFEEAGSQNMMKAVMNILKSDDGNAVFLMNGEYIVLTRLNDKLILNSASFGDADEKEWNLKEIPFADYDVKELDLAG